jgi:hypothetical protein
MREPLPGQYRLIEAPVFFFDLFIFNMADFTSGWCVVVWACMRVVLWPVWSATGV